MPPPFPGLRPGTFPPHRSLFPASRRRGLPLRRRREAAGAGGRDPPRAGRSPGRSRPGRTGPARQVRLRAAKPSPLGSGWAGRDGRPGASPAGSGRTGETFLLGGGGGEAPAAAEASAASMGPDTLPLGTYGGAAAAALLLWAVCVLCRRRRKTGEPPLINGWIPYLGKALIFRKDAYKFLLDQQKKFGDIFTVHIAGRYITFIMDPFQYVYVIRNSKQLEFHEFANKMASKTFDYPALSKGKFPELKENLHRIYQYLQGKPLDIISDHMMKNLQDIFEWKCSQATDWETEKMYKFCCSVMFEASFVTLYGRVPAADGHKVISEIRDKFIKFDASFPYLAANIPIELLGATKKVRKELIHHFLLQNMTKWLGGSKVVQARQDIFEKYELLGDYDKAAHHFAFLWASVGNTIPATFWAMYYLLRHPEALAAVRDEIDHLLQSTGQKRGPTYNIHLTREQLDNLVYLESALNESLRMCSSSMNIRISQEDFVLKLEGEQEVVLRKGDWIALYPQILHMDPEVYEDPKEYKFDRYIEDGKKKTTFYKAGRKLKYFLMPFGSGISMCPGRFLAMNEMKMFLFILLSHFDVELAENKAVRLDNSRMGLGILLPDVDIAFRYKLRSLRN
ncbi:cytochrome P450 7B1 isoform X2 [Motacilla alba alba]|uniref:cytochrome P450 7B1 isoform X2 n=1 Tax=Motacilla alba alba TaxID=1094192 RepID=UPI0018D53BDF|nr:cytochrome P450 7B1 isoform X2 [Motacilla alba alba]